MILISTQDVCLSVCLSLALTHKYNIQKEQEGPMVFGSAQIIALFIAEQNCG
jgi:hypothetical protein